MASRNSKSSASQLFAEIGELLNRMMHAPASSPSLDSDIGSKCQELVIKLYPYERKSVTDDKKTFTAKLVELFAQEMEHRKLYGPRQFNQMVSEFSVLLYKHTPGKDFLYKLYRRKGREIDTSDNDDKKDKKKKEPEIAQGKHKSPQKILFKICSKIGRQKDTSVNNDKKDKKKKELTEDSAIPIPVELIAEGVQLPTTSINLKSSTTDDYAADCSKSDSSTDDSRDNDFRKEIMRNVNGIPKLKYKELKHATNNWSPTNLIGQGGFGFVFEGKWKNLKVAVKRLRNTDVRNKELVRELCLNQYRHDNIVPLYGYSCEGPEVCIVYQLLKGGSLEARLHYRDPTPAPLTWPERLKIALGIARALDFLHTMMSKPLIHGDIKPANILLDEWLTPKIGDFGLARNGPHKDKESHLTVSRVGGTHPYLPDDYLRSRCLSPAVDVFSFGVMMLEIATGLKPIDNTRHVQRLTDIIRKGLEKGRDTALYEDRMLHGTQQSNPHHCREFISIGVHCTRLQRSERPKMIEVYKRLEIMMAPEKRPSASTSKTLH